jgi:hypothetical protein
MKFVKFLCFVVFAVESVVASGANAPQSQRPIVPMSGTVVWTCQAFYLPARSIWKRTVAIDYGTEEIRSVVIDGVPVYTFNVVDSSVLTAIDGERIQFDAIAQTWTSDLRGLVSSQGRCERS